MIRKNNTMRGGIIILLVIILLVNFVDFVNAVGVASSYWRDNPLMISPGETKTIYLGLQNMVGTEDITLKAVLKQGSEIATTEEKTYFVKAGTKDTQVPITISIPEDVPLNTEYQVTVSFQTVTVGTGGAVALGTGIETTFDVALVPKVLAPEAVIEGIIGEAPTQQKSPLIPLLILAIIIILIIIILIIYKKKNKEKNISMTSKTSKNPEKTFKNKTIKA